MKQRALARDVDTLQGCPVLYKSPEGYVTLFASKCKGKSNSANPSEYICQDDDGMWYVETAPSQEDMRRRTLESYRYLFGRILRM